MNKILKICCCTGHRPNGFPWNYYQKFNKKHAAYLRNLKKLIIDKINQGFNYFISGGAIGVDMDFAEIILALKKKYPSIQLEIAIPCPNQDLKWLNKDKWRYKKILKNCDKKVLVNTEYTNYCMQKRNRYMVDKSEAVIAVWNGKKFGGTYNTIKYAKEKRKEIDFIYLANE